MPSCPTCQRPVGEGVAQCPSDGTAIPGAMGAHPWIGKVLGDRYRILGKLGQGGMGTVFLAEHVVLGKQLAIKVLREDFSRDEGLVKRFQQEAISASQIGHENIVDVTDFGRSPEGALYFVMELLQGVSLARIVQRDGPLPPSRALPILIQICRALAAAHARGIVHRDLKPDNVMVLPKDDGSELVKVLDFGISKVSQGQTERITRVGMLMGTPEYMAPEQIDAVNVDHRVDIYALGVLAYEVVTGNVPFQAQTPVMLLLKHQTEPPVAPSKRRPDLLIPARLEAAILKALAKNPAERHPSMAELANELAAIARELDAARMTQSMPGTPAPIPLRSSQPVIKLVTPAPPPATAEAASIPPGTTPPRALSATVTETSAPSHLTPASAIADTAVTARPTTPGASPAPTVVEATRNTLAPEERVAVRNGSGALIGVLVLLVFALAGGLGYVVMQKPAHKDDVQPPVPLTDGVDAPSMLSAGGGRAKPQPPPAPTAPKPPKAEPTPTRAVKLESTPTGAQVLLGDQMLGTTPQQIELKDGETKTYRFVLSGYAPKEQQISSTDGVVSVKLEKLRRGGRGTAKNSAGDDENPYRKIDDLKANPF